MRDLFHEHLDHVSERLVALGDAVADAMETAAQALFEGDLEKAEKVIAGDTAIDQMRVDLDDLGVELLARQQPVATDLRMVVTAMHMATDLERMGDLAEHIAKVARLRFPEAGVHESARELLSKMGECAVEIARRASKAIEAKDAQAAVSLHDFDHTMDDLHKQVFQLLDESWDGTVPQAIDVTLLSRYFERYGDHAVTIARRVEYLVTGEWASTPSHQPAAS